MKRTIEQAVDLSVPVRTAYNQWTQFEEFPRFMEGVEEVRQLDDRRVRWRTALGGRPVEWEVEICEQIPDKRVAWKSVDGPWNAGVATFHRITDDRSKLMLQVDYEPEGFRQIAGELLGRTRSHLRDELEEFKRFIEQRGRETGSWRGAIANADERAEGDTQERR